MSIMKLIRRRLAEWLWPGQTAVMTTVETKHVQIARLTQDTLKHIQHKANGNTFVTHQTTELQAGFQLGVQHVLNVLSQDFTIAHS